MAPPPARGRKKFVSIQCGTRTSVTKEVVTKKSVTKTSAVKKTGKSIESNGGRQPACKRKQDLSGTMTPPPAKKRKTSIESNGWKKPASKRNQPPSGRLLRSMSLFFKLPLEIRFMIYSYLVSSKKLELFRSCQKIHREAAGIVYRNCILVVTDHGEPGLPSYLYGREDAVQREPISDNVQNLKIYSDLENFVRLGEKYRQKDYLGAHYPEFKNPNISRRKCWIHLSTHCRVLWEPHTGRRLITMLRALRQFESVFLNIGQIEGARHDRCHGRPRGDLDADFKSRVKSLGKGLERVFGPATWENNPYTLHQRWKFHPRQERPRG